jgi:predicted PurR-regulated permease PerM
MLNKQIDNGKILTYLQYVFFISVILYFGRTLFIPLSFSILISGILYPPTAWLEKKGFGKAVAIASTMTLLVLFALTLLFILVVLFLNFMSEWEFIRQKILESINDLSIYLSANLNISLDLQRSWMNNILNSSGSQILGFIRSAFYSISVSLVLIILVPLISGLILFYRTMLFRFTCGLFPNRSAESVREIILGTVTTYYSFIKGMIVVYIIVGILNSLGLWILGIPHPVLFGFTASILTFIPYVGIVVGSLLPIAISWVTYNSILFPLGVIAVFAFVQYLEANLIFPLAVSSRLNINTLVTIIAIIAGGVIWGAAGMILFIPFAGILKIIADKSGDMPQLSMILGKVETGSKKKLRSN